VAIGIGHTKVQAKLANHLAKKCPGAEGVFDLTAQAAPDPWLVRMPVADQGSTETSASP
jgi:DNA polymerase V